MGPSPTIFWQDGRTKNDAIDNTTIVIDFLIFFFILTTEEGFTPIRNSEIFVNV